jgi:GAF domain-containing protein/two-component sensor histidine kinase
MKIDKVMNTLDHVQATSLAPYDSLLSTVRGIMLRDQDISTLGQATCEVLASSMDYAAAWLARVEEHDRRAQIVGLAGDRSELQEIILPQDAQVETSIACDGKISIFSRSMIEDEQAEFSYEHACIPLCYEGQFIGELHICKPPQESYSEDELILLKTVAADVAAGITRLQLDQQRKQLVREVESLRDLSAEMISGREIKDLFRTLVQQVTALLHGHAGGLYVCEPEQRQVRCVVSHQTDRDYVGTVLRYGEGAAGVVAETGEPLIIPDYGCWEKRAECFSTSAFHAVLSVPMRWQGQVTGVIHVLRNQDAPPFSQADCELLILYANQAAVVLENAGLLEDIKKRILQLDQLSEISRTAILVGDLEELIPGFLQSLSKMTGADQGFFFQWDRARNVPFLLESIGLDSASGEHGQIQVEDLQIITDALEAGYPLVADHPGESALLPHWIGERWGAKTVLAAPVTDGQTWYGVALLIFHETTAIRPEEIELVGQATAQVALTVAKMNALEVERKRTYALEALRTASLNLTSKLEIKAVLESILSNAMELVTADDAHIFLYDRDKLSFGAAKWADGRHDQPFATPRPKGLTYSVVRSGETIVVPNVDHHELFEDTGWGGAIVGLPLKVREKVVGVMNVAFLQPHDFEEAELVGLGLLADQAAIMIQNAKLFESVDKERRFVQLIYDVAQELVNTLSQDEILQRAVSLTASHLNARSCEAFILDPFTRRLIPRASARKDQLDLSDIQEKLTLEFGEGLVGWVVQAGQPVLIGDVTEDDRWVTVDDVDDMIRSAICAPLIAGGEMLGVIGVYHTEKEAYTLEHLDLLVAIARQVSVAVSNAQRYAQIDRRLTEMTVVRQVVQVVNRRLEMQALLDEVVHQVGAVLGYPVVEVYLVEERFLKLGASYGGPFDLGTRYHISEGILGRVVRTNRAAFVPDVSKDSDYIVGYPETTCEIVVPLRIEGVVIGVLNVESPRPGDLSEEDSRLLMLLADQLAVAVENAALYERVRSHAESLESVVAKRTSELAEALIRAQAADRLKTQFVSDVSHELRTPLSNIRLYLDLLRKGTPDRFEDYMRTLNRETNRLVNLIEDLLAISRLDAGTVTPHPASFDLNVLARGLVEDRRRLFGDRDLTLGLSLQSDLPNVVADEQMISQVIANLMTNALNYTPAGGSVTLITRKVAKNGEEWVTLAIRDTGLGIPEKERDQIFERFFRGEASRKMGTPGTGLGLSICQEILMRHHGNITLESEAQKGSTFTIWLPLILRPTH